MNPYFWSDGAAIFSLLIALVIIVLNLLILFLVIKAAVVQGLRYARREEWVERYDLQNARWLTETQRQKIASRAPAADETA